MVPHPDHVKVVTLPLSLGLRGVVAPFKLLTPQQRRTLTALDNSKLEKAFRVEALSLLSDKTPLFSREIAVVMVDNVLNAVVPSGKIIPVGDLWFPQLHHFES